MVTTFQVILFIIMIVACLGAVSDDHMQRVMSLASICIASMFAFVASVMWL